MPEGRHVNFSLEAYDLNLPGTHPHAGTCRIDTRFSAADHGHFPILKQTGLDLIKCTIPEEIHRPVHILEFHARYGQGLTPLRPDG